MSLSFFSKVKELAQLVVLATSVGLALRFILNVGDPIFGTVPATHVHFMYSNLRVVVDTLYWATNMAMVPITQVFGAIPKTAWGEYTSVFPITPSFLVGDWIQQQLLLIPPFPFIDKYMLTEDPRAWMPGVIDWRALVGAIAYPVVLPLLQSAFDAAKQLVMTVLVEATHSHKKEDRFKQALKAKNAELQKFNTDFENLHQEIHSLSEAVTIDELTKAYNRRFFSEKVRELFQKQKQAQRLMSILMIDIDHFKGVNDTYGHQVGDEVYQAKTQGRNQVRRAQIV